MKIKSLIRAAGLVAAVAGVVLMAGNRPKVPQEVAPEHRRQDAASFAQHFFAQKQSDTQRRKADAALQPSAELRAAMPPTPGNRALVAAHAEFVIQTIGESLGIPEAQRPSYQDLLDEMYQAWLKERRPETEVAKLVQLDRLQRTSGIGQPYNSVAATSLTPYLVEAGLCTGSPWSEQGLVCTYVDRDPGGPRVTGSVRRGGEDEPTALQEAPEDSALARILTASRQPPASSTVATLPTPDNDGFLSKALNATGTAIGAVCDVLIPSAHAQIAVPPVPPVDLPSVPGFNFENCAVQIPTASTTQVIKLDPYALGLLIFMETVGRIKDPGAPWADYLQTTVAATFIKNWLGETKKIVEQSVLKRTNKAADRAARNACRNQTQGSTDYNNCYARAYDNQIYASAGASYGLSLLTGWVEEVAVNVALTGTSGDAFITALKAFAVQTLLKATAQIDVYGEAYQLTTVQYGATDGDQVFGVFPFGFACATDECTGVAQCAIQADDPIACMDAIARLKNWDMRPKGGVIEHSINTCLVQALPYRDRVPYKALRTNEATTGSTGLPRDITFRSAYQTPGLYKEPNRCEANQTGDPANTANATQGQAVEHACPHPSNKEGPTTPTPVNGIMPRLDADASPNQNLATATSTRRPPELIPYWRWNLSKLNSRTTDYTAIYAGLTSTKASYEVLRNPPDLPLQMTGIPGTGQLLPPDCSSTRTFYGVKSAPGQAFWAFHGEANKAPEVSVEMMLGAAVGSGLSFYQLYEKKEQYSQARFWGYLFTSMGIAGAFNANQTYDCSVYPISTSVLCQGDGKGVYTATSRTMHPMPEVNVILADDISHAPVACSLNDSQSEAQFFAYGGSIARPAAGKSDTLYFTISRSGASKAAAYLDYATEAGKNPSEDAVPGSEYKPVSGRLFFAAGESRKTIAITVYGNNSTNGTTRKVYLRVANASGAAMPQQPVATGNIYAP
jgi:hypothetical protein